MTSKFIPALTLAALLAASGAVIVSAQTAEPAQPEAGASTTAPATEAPATGSPTTPDAAIDGPATRTGVFGLSGRDHGGRGPGGGLLRGVLGQADANGDGAITQAEVDAVRASLVGGADASGEGDLSLEEFQAVYLQLVRPQLVDAFQDLDEDGDAQVTAEELDARLGGVVAQLDRDGDGALSAADRPERGGRGPDGDDGFGRRGGFGDGRG